MHRPRLAAIAAAFSLALVTSVSGCNGSDADEPVVAVTLPPGDLSDQVLQPDDVPEGLVPLLAQTGTANINRIAGFSSDSATAERSLREHGFQKAYVVQYGDPKTGRYIVNVVVSFETEAGATEDLTADLDAARGSGTPFPIDDLGDQAGGLRASRAAPAGDAASASASGPPSAAGSASASASASAAAPSPSPSGSAPVTPDLVTVRWRKGAQTWLLAVGAPGTVEQDAVVRLARLILQRAQGDAQPSG